VCHSRSMLDRATRLQYHAGLHFHSLCCTIECLHGGKVLLPNIATSLNVLLWLCMTTASCLRRKFNRVRFPNSRVYTCILAIPSASKLHASSLLRCFGTQAEVLNVTVRVCESILEASGVLISSCIVVQRTTAQQGQGSVYFRALTPSTSPETR
jgi:hypothetical protein